MNKVKEYVTKRVTQISDLIKAECSYFDFLQLRGSAEENLKIYYPDEFDFVLFSEKWKDKITFNERQNLPGFAYAMRQASTCLDRYQLTDPAGVIDPVQVRAHMKNLVVKALDKLGITTTVTEVGPVINFDIPSEEKSFPTIDIDLVLYIQQENWPTTATTVLSPELRALGVGLVPKVLEEDEEVWQISFSAIEIQLFKGIDADGGSRRKLLKIMKYLKLITEWPKTVSSYHLKTIIMKMNQEHPDRAYWIDANLVARFRELLNAFLNALKTKALPSFFIPTFNLLKGKDLTEAIQKVEKLIEIIKTDPNSLFPQQSAMCNPPQTSSSVSNKPLKNKSLKKRLRIHS
ncbi:Hypothetical predicted protein [Paramuricea clavata]|uniref:Uncharacterized protein n=1 Tax=Paramuricea clavata TaxID=317549 RepID=A0A7D9I983_PARCT|nr:Hypothetical predicted protein [Paramuricea clavata]